MVILLFVVETALVRSVGVSCLVFGSSPPVTPPICALPENSPRDTLHKEGVPPDFDNSGFMLFSSASVAFLPYGVGSLLPYLRD